jgi:hypothetical protein
MTVNELYESTRGDWVLGKARNLAKYAFTVYHGIVREVYRIDGWTAVTAKGKNVKRRDRWQFTGIITEELSHYKNRRVSSYIKKGNQSPVLYVNCRKG